MKRKFESINLSNSDTDLNCFLNNEENLSKKICTSIKELAGKLVDSSKFPEPIHNTLSYQLNNFCKLAKKINDNHLKSPLLTFSNNNINYDVKSLDGNFTEVIHSILIYNANIDELKKRIELVKNKLESDITSSKDLSKDLLNLSMILLDVLNNKESNNESIKESIEVSIGEISKIRFSLSITNNEIEKNSNELKKLELLLSKSLNSYQIYLSKIVDLKIDIFNIFNKFKSNLSKFKELSNLQSEIKTFTNIQSLVKAKILKSIHDKDDLKKILAEKFSDLYYYNHIKRINGCTGCNNECCKKMHKKIKKNDNSIEIYKSIFDNHINEN